jgi:hypothetical protein
VFKDKDSQYYMIYGGWKHCNITRLKDDFTGFLPFEDGSTFKEITPEGYVEGPFMFEKNGKYYFMWSEGGWEALITACMPSPILSWGLPSWRQTLRWPRAPDTTPSCMNPSQMTGILCTTGDPWGKLTPTTGLPALTA